MKRALDGFFCLLAISSIVGCMGLYAIQAVTISVIHNSTPTAPKIQPYELPRIQLYFFTQTSCAHCKQLKSSLKSPQCQKWIDKRFYLTEVDAHSDDALRYGVTLTPTLVAVGKKGTEKLVGYHTPDDLAIWLGNVALKEGMKSANGHLESD